MNLERLYEFRFRNVDQSLRDSVWREIALYLYEILARPKTVLDPAAGRGEFINAIPADERWAVDTADMGSYFTQGIHFVNCGIFEADLPQDHFDAVFVSNFLEHLPDPNTVQAFLQRMYRSLRPGGHIAVMGPNFRYCYKDYFDCADHTLILTDESVQEHLYAAGFSIVAVFPKFLPYSFRQRVPITATLVRWYLRVPLLWRLFGKQFLIIGNKHSEARVRQSTDISSPASAAMDQSIVLHSSSRIILIRRLLGATAFTSKKLRSFVKFAFSGVMLLLSLLFIVPWFPAMPLSGLDPSWALAVIDGFQRSLQHGTEIIFTTGPFGLLFPNAFAPQFYPWDIIFFTILASCLGILGSIALVTRLSLYSFLALLLIVMVLPSRSLSFILLFLLFIFFAFGEQSRWFRIITVALAFIAALVAQVKFSYAIAGLIPVLLADCYSLIKRQGRPLCLAGYVSSFLVFYLLSRQSLANLPEYLLGQLSITSGYSAAMSVNHGSTIRVALYLLLAAALIVFDARVRWRREGLGGLLPTLALSAVLFTAFKAGFVRHDGHEMIALGTLIAAFAINGAYLWNMSASRRFRWLLMVFAIVSLILYQYTAYLQWGHRPFQPLFAIGDRMTSATRAISDIANGQHRAKLNAAYEAALADIRKSFPLPNIQGSVDVYPWESSTVIAHGLEYKHRPVFQSYAAYTEYLIEQNRNSLLGGQAPNNILFDVAAIDGRLPATEDGASWPEILSRYDLADASGPFLLFERRKTPRTVEYRRLGERKVMFDESTFVPESEDPIWATVDLRLNILGRMASFLFKPPQAKIKIVFDGDSRKEYRIIPAAARSGFMLSPIITNRYEFAAIVLGHIGDFSPTVKAVEVNTTEFGQWFYKQPINLRFSRLAIDGLGVPASQTPKFSLLLELIRGGEQYNHAPALRNIEGRPVAFAHAPMRMRVAEQSGSQLKVGFGIVDGAWSKGETNGVCFAVWGESEGKSKEIWSRCLDPKERTEDRGPQNAVITLPSETPDSYVFDTDTRGDSRWDWSYWTDVEFVGGNETRTFPGSEGLMRAKARGADLREERQVK